MRRAVYAGTVVLVAAAGIYSVSDSFLKEKIFRASYGEKTESDLGKLETVEGVGFPVTKRGAVIDRDMAHVAVPYEKSRLFKKARVKISYAIQDGTSLELGIRKSQFWRDYERKPVRNLVIDELVKRAEWNWDFVEAGGIYAYLNPRFDLEYASLADFSASLPEGRIALYGNTALDCGEKCVTVGMTNDIAEAEKMAAIYAAYAPDRCTEDYCEAEIEFPLAGAYQNPDGSFDLMLYAFPQPGGKPRVIVRSLEVSVENTFEGIGGALKALPASLKKQIVRTPSAL